MASLIPADQVGTQIYNLLVEVVENEYKGSNQGEKDLALYHILDVLATGWFH